MVGKDTHAESMAVPSERIRTAIVILDQGRDASRKSVPAILLGPTRKGPSERGTPNGHEPSAALQHWATSDLPEQKREDPATIPCETEEAGRPSLTLVTLHSPAYGAASPAARARSHTEGPLGPAERGRKACTFLMGALAWHVRLQPGLER